MASRTQAVLARVKRMKSLDRQIERTKRKIDALREERDRLEAESIKFMDKGRLDSLTSGSTRVSISEVDVPTLRDFDKFFKFVVKNRAPELLHRRVNSTAWRDRDKKVPGVGTFTKRSLSITRSR